MPEQNGRTGCENAMRNAENSQRRRLQGIKVRQKLSLGRKYILFSHALSLRLSLFFPAEKTRINLSCLSRSE